MVLIVSCVLGALGLPGAWFLLPDDVFFAAFFAVGIAAVREMRGRTPATGEQRPMTTAV